jgi:large subunit ribosomal protein L35Ae
MEGIIENYRLSRHVQKGNHMIVLVNGVNTREDAEKLVGKEVIYKTKNGEIKGKVASAHGNKGAIRVIFEKGMPGQALAQKVTIN